MRRPAYRQERRQTLPEYQASGLPRERLLAPVFDRLAQPVEALARKIEGWVDEAGYFDQEMNTEVNADLTYDTALPRAA